MRSDGEDQRDSGDAAYTSDGYGTGSDGMRVDLDALAKLTAAQHVISTTLATSAADLSGGGLCDWADTGPAHRAAMATAERLRELGSQLRACGSSVDALATDLSRAGRAFAATEDAAVVAVTRWSR
ncbi:hypothetical protein [Gordonia sp. (in: high G+C Gram-positive bacteria)]|uniref:hypothetical protein n=1 Tax=Gordonia sp. (in: high G+C Gram-positive bacteria) TaxID=84139 RepID=UPI003C758BBD